MVTFIIRGKVFELSRDDIIKALEESEAEPFTGRRKYYIEWNEKKYPIKQVLSLVTGLPKIAFTATDAYRVLTKLGFEVKELK